jgi:thioredoxin reductase (NADPH)
MEQQAQPQPGSAAEQGNQVYDVIIIGGGPAGSSAAIYTARAGLSTLVLDKGLTAGALGITSKIANYPGIPEAISGADLLERIRSQARTFGAEYKTDKVIGVDLLSATKIIIANGGSYLGRAVILASGSMGRGSRVKGEDALLGRGVSYCATCDAAFFKNQQVALAGNSDEAIEEGLFLTKFVECVHFLSPTPELKAPQHLIDEINGNQKVTFYPGASLREIVGTEKVEAIRFAMRGQPEQSLPVTGAFIYLQGGLPVTDFLQGQLETGEGGCLVVDREFRTAAEGVFAIGDLICNHVKQAVIAAADGAMAGIAVEKALRGREKLAVDWGK